MNRKNPRRHQKPAIVSVCGDIVVRGTIHQVINSHEALAVQAERNFDAGAMHAHFQHADHYRRLAAGQGAV